jgi:hypothetical protein
VFAGRLGGLRDTMTIMRSLYKLFGYVGSIIGRQRRRQSQKVVFIDSLGSLFELDGKSVKKLNQPTGCLSTKELRKWYPDAEK